MWPSGLPRQPAAEHSRRADADCERGRPSRLTASPSRARGVLRAAALLLLSLVTAVGSISCRSTPQPLETPRPSLWPLKGVRGHVTARFRPRGARPHLGLDLAAPRGTPVVAAADGIVRQAVRKPRYGRLVILDHAHGLETRYAHLRRLVVREGQRVVAGEVIGAVGRSGNATGYHLHYEVRVHGAAVDPAGYLPELER